MYCVTLLLVLFGAAVCLASTDKDRQREETLKYLEERMKPCILENKGCPEDGSLNYAKIASMMRTLVAMRLPEECLCDVGVEDCGRRCYYAYLVKSTLMGVANGKTDPDEIRKAQKEAMDSLERYYKPCLIEKKNCIIVGGFDYSTVESLVRQYKKSYALPSECDGDLNSESSIRKCYYHYVKNLYLNSLGDKKKRRA